MDCFVTEIRWRTENRCDTTYGKMEMYRLQCKEYGTRLWRLYTTAREASEKTNAELTEQQNEIRAAHIGFKEGRKIVSNWIQT